MEKPFWSQKRYLYHGLFNRLTLSCSSAQFFLFYLSPEYFGLARQYSNLKKCNVTLKAIQILCDTIFSEAYPLTGSLRGEQKKTFAFGYTRGGILNGGRRGRGKNQIMKNDAKSKSLYASPVSYIVYIKTGEAKRSQFTLLFFYLVKTQKIFYSFTWILPCSLLRCQNLLRYFTPEMRKNWFSQIPPSDSYCSH